MKYCYSKYKKTTIPMVNLYSLEETPSGPIPRLEFSIAEAEMFTSLYIEAYEEFLTWEKAIKKVSDWFTMRITTILLLEEKDFLGMNK